MNSNTNDLTELATRLWAAGCTVDALLESLVEANNAQTEQMPMDELQLLTRAVAAQPRQQPPPITVEEVREVLDITVKQDNTNKLVTFLCMLSAYTAESQFNISFNAPSSTGKTYIPMQIKQLFPAEDVIELAYTSPTAFFHQEGSIEPETNVRVIDLAHKIMIFLDQPQMQLMANLRPLLSHDDKVITVKITDKNNRGGNRTKEIRILGYPAVIFCSASMNVDEQESTRFILLSPEVAQGKIKAAIHSKLSQVADPEGFRQVLAHNPQRMMLQARIVAIKAAGVKYVRVVHGDLVENYFSRGVAYRPRHQRDVDKVMAIIQALALLNCWYRERAGEDIVASKEDVEVGLALWEEIAESQEYDLPPYLFDFYWDVIVAGYNEKNADVYEDEKTGLKRQEIIKKYNQVYGRLLADYKLRMDMLPMLEMSGLISMDASASDKRVQLIQPNLLIRTGRYSVKNPVANPEDNSQLVETIL